MYQAPQTVWNRIARLQSLKTKWAKVMFSLNQDEALRVLDAVGERLKSKGISPKAILAYLTVLPLLIEREAIQEYVTVMPDSAAAFPEVLSRTEAAILMTNDLMMLPEETSQLLSLLQSNPNQIATLWQEPINESMGV